MKKILKKLIVGTLLGIMLLGVAGCSSTPLTEGAEEGSKTSITNIVAFGDSFSDNGGANRVSTAIVEAGTEEKAFIKPGDLYWENRYSNGKTFIEVASELAGLPLTNYAVGGATSGYENYSEWMDSQGGTGVLGQIEQYAASLNGEQADGTTLFYIFGGLNDYFKFVDYSLEGTVEGVGNQVVANIEAAVRNLAEVGAKNFLIPYAFDTAYIPYEITEGRQEYAKDYAKTVNAQLPELVEALSAELGLNITTYDITKTIEDIVSNTDKYGITEFINVVQPTWPEVLPAVTENVESYMFYDEWHPTAATHKIIGEALYQEIKNIQ